MEIGQHVLTTWAANRLTTIRELKRLGEIIKRHARNAKIASAVGNGTGLISGVGAAICYLAVPVTLGASFVPAVALTGVAISGGLTSAGSSFTNFLIKKNYMKDAQAALDIDRKCLDALKSAIENAKKLTSLNATPINVGTKLEIAKNVGKNIPTGISFGANVIGKLSKSEKAIAVLLRLGKTARFAGHVVTFVAIPIDLIFFVKDAVDLAKGNVSAAADQVFKLARELQEQYDKIMSEAEKTKLAKVQH